MNSNPLFNTNRDRKDFFIALLVLLFFAWLIWWYGIRCTCVETDPTNAALLPATEEVDQFAFLNKDENATDVVAKKRTIIEDEVVTKRDTLAKIVLTDTDKDGVPDRRDKCPTAVGPITNNGCPLDSDGDGINDKSDRCPQEAGVIANNGCPADTDKDGVYDKVDKCPRLAGVASNKGCPPDSDGDGVYDTVDKCPNRPGLARLKGCPEVKIEEEERKLITEEIKNLAFETGNAVLKKSSTRILDKVVKVMEKYPDYKLDITGHTDNVGKPQSNLILSQQRAKACYDYLVSKGIQKSRLLSKGMGETQPIDSNDTNKGRQNNRRVNFDLHY